MKHIFVLNPVAGKGKAEIEILPKIIKAVKESGIDYEIHRTINVGDAEHFVKNRCRLNPNESLRFYAIGGDGTLNETANGAYGFENAEIAFIPAGSGNDFARVFKEYKYFRDIKRQIYGTSRPVDLIKYNNRYAINMLNIGLDCTVAVKAAELKNKPFLKGPMAYVGGIVPVLAVNKGFNLEVSIEKRAQYQGVFTLIAIANGAYCGGGFKGVPKAEIDDGLLDVSIVNKVNRRTSISLLAHYRNGTHLDIPKVKDIIIYEKCRSITVKSADTMQYCADGEVENTDELSVSIIPGAIHFSVPEGCE